MNLFSNRLINKYFSILLLLTITFSQSGLAQQQKDSLKRITWVEKKQEFKRSMYVTLPLIAAGIIAKSDNNLFSNTVFEDIRNDRFGDFESNFDDFLAIAPVGAVFTIDIFKRTSRNDFLNQSLLLIKSELIMSALVFPMKAWSKQERPDGSNDQSFPSGHTAQAFVGATFLHKEYGGENFWYSIAAFTTASSVGIYRVLNNKHYINDVLIGASIGILSTNIAYLTHQHRWGNKSERFKNVSFMPTYIPSNRADNSSGKLGLFMSIKL